MSIVKIMNEFREEFGEEQFKTISRKTDANKTLTHNYLKQFQRGATKVTEEVLNVLKTPASDESHMRSAPYVADLQPDMM